MRDVCFPAIKLCHLSAPIKRTFTQATIPPALPLPAPRSVQRSKISTMARLTRTVSKLGSSRGSKARQAGGGAPPFR